MNTDKIFAEAIANEYAPKDTSKVVALIRFQVFFSPILVWNPFSFFTIIIQI